MKRRHFLIGAGSAVTLAGAGTLAHLLRHDQTDPNKFPETGFLLGEGKREAALYPELAEASRRVPAPGSMTLMAANGQIFRRWSVPFFPHSVKQNPSNKQMVIGTQKWGQHFAILNPQTDELIVRKSADDHDFFGHTDFLDNGKFFAVSGAKTGLGLGMIHIYDSKTLELVNAFSTGGMRPHDIQVDRHNPDLLIIANSGRWKDFPTDVNKKGWQDLPHVPRMTWLNWRTGKIVRNALPQAPKVFMTAHFTQDEDKLLLGGISPTKTRAPSFGVFDETKGELVDVSLSWNNTEHAECLNLFADKKNNRIWLAMPEMDLVHIIDRTTYATVKKITLHEARSFVHLGGDLLLISTPNSSLGQQAAFSLSTMEPLNESEASRAAARQVVLDSAYSVHSNLFKLT